MIETNRVLQQFGKTGVDRSRVELTVERRIRGRKVRRLVSGDLRDGIYYKVLRRKSEFRVQFGVKGAAAKYAPFIHEGVNGTVVKVGSPYSFKSKYVNIGAVESWIRNKPIRLQRTFVNKYGQRVSRFVKMTGEEGERNIRGAAIAMAKSIAENGIVGVPFLDAGTEWAYDKMQRKLADAIEKDALENLVTE